MINIILNVLLNYKKYRKIVGEQVKIVKNNGGKKYDFIVGQYGFVTGFEFENKQKPLIIYFPNINEYDELCFSFEEIKLAKEERESEENDE